MKVLVVLIVFAVAMAFAFPAAEEVAPSDQLDTVQAEDFLRADDDFVREKRQYGGYGGYGKIA